jgi:hypothetical protein
LYGIVIPDPSILEMSFAHWLDCPVVFFRQDASTLLQNSTFRSTFGLLEINTIQIHCANSQTNAAIYEEKRRRKKKNLLNIGGGVKSFRRTETQCLMSG